MYSIDIKGPMKSREYIRHFLTSESTLLHVVKLVLKTLRETSLACVQNETIASFAFNSEH